MKKIKNQQNPIQFTKCEHEFQEIIGFCLSKECRGNSSYCLDCIQRDTHDSHLVDLKTIDEIVIMLVEQQTTIEELQTKMRVCRLNNFNEMHGKWNYIINRKLKYMEDRRTYQFLSLINKIKEPINELIKIVLQVDKKQIENQIFKIWPYHKIHKNYQQKQMDCFQTYYERLDNRIQQFIKFYLQASYKQKLQSFLLAQSSVQNVDLSYKRIETLEKLGEYDFANEGLAKILSIAPNDINLNEKIGESLMKKVSKIEEFNGFNKENPLQYQNEIIKTYELKQFKREISRFDFSLRKCYDLVFAGRFEEAVKLFEEFLHKSNDEEGCLRFIDQLLGLRQYSQSIEQLRQYLKKFPQNYEAKSKLHILLEIKNNQTKAIGCFQKILEIQPNNLSVYQKICQILELNESYEEAFQCYQKMIQLEPKNELGYLLKGDLLERCRNFEGAIQCFDELINSQPYNENGYLKKCHILETYEIQKFEEKESYGRTRCCCTCPFNKPYDRLLEFYEQFIKLFPHNKFGYIKKTNLLERLRRCPKALKWFKRYNGRERKQKLLEVINNYEDAIQCCKQLIKICPQEQYGYLQMGEILKQYELNEEGVNCFEEMIKLHPNNKLGYFNKGYFLEKLNRFDEACQCYEELISIQPTIEEGYWYKGQLLEKLNRPKEAIECIDRFIQIQPQNDFGPRYKNQILEQMKKNNQAI